VIACVEGVRAVSVVPVTAVLSPVLSVLVDQVLDGAEDPVDAEQVFLLAVGSRSERSAISISQSGWQQLSRSSGSAGG
jgi:hypothetical protein